MWLWRHSNRSDLKGPKGERVQFDCQEFRDCHRSNPPARVNKTESDETVGVAQHRRTLHMALRVVNNNNNNSAVACWGCCQLGGGGWDRNDGRRVSCLSGRIQRYRVQWVQESNGERTSDAVIPQEYPESEHTGERPEKWHRGRVMQRALL